MNIANRTPATGVFVPSAEAAEVRAPRLIVRGRPTSDGAGVRLTATAHDMPRERFTAPDGDALSDHPPVVVTFAWRETRR